jgi:hypothetical protein
MILTVLRTAFLVYVRVLLCLQAMYLGFLALMFFSGREADDTSRAMLFVFLGLAGMVTAILLRRGRRWAAIAAILIEALWAATFAVVGYEASMSEQPVWPLLAGAVFLVTVVGLLLRPVRAYAGLVRRGSGAAVQRLWEAVFVWSGAVVPS